MRINLELIQLQNYQICVMIRVSYELQLRL
jgi:hypothetical protein